MVLAIVDRMECKITRDDLMRSEGWEPIRAPGGLVVWSKEGRIPNADGTWIAVDPAYVTRLDRERSQVREDIARIRARLGVSRS